MWMRREAKMCGRVCRETRNPVLHGRWGHPLHAALSGWPHHLPPSRSVHHVVAMAWVSSFGLVIWGSQIKAKVADYRGLSGRISSDLGNFDVVVDICFSAAFIHKEQPFDCEPLFTYCCSEYCRYGRFAMWSKYLHRDTITRPEHGAIKPELEGMFLWCRKIE